MRRLRSRRDPIAAAAPPSEPTPPPTPLTADAVRLVYEKLLDRTPRDAEVEHQLATCTGLGDLLDVVLASEELAMRRQPVVRPVGGLRANAWTPELDRFTRRPGSVSADGVAVVGHEGLMFIVGGTNSVLDQFTGAYTLPDGWEDEWRALWDARAAAVARIGAQALWVVVPDKVAVAADRLPEPVTFGRRPVQRLIEDAGLDLLYPCDALRAAPGEAFLRTDSHLSLRGNAVLAREVLAAVDGPPPPEVGQLAVSDTFAAGDLGARFDPPIAEVITTATEWPVEVVEDNSAQLGAVGGHLGTRRVTRNAGAPDARTCVLFGDSFGQGTPAYQGLAWWLGRAFREVHFVWLPFGWDASYAARAGADVVVFQGAERFCVRVPQAEVDVDELAAETIRRRAGIDLSEL